MKSVGDGLYFVTQMLADYQQINAQVRRQFAQQCQSPRTRRSHYFAGRYENIYIDRARIPALEPMLKAARQGACEFVGCDEVDRLAVGFWFNEMHAGHVTLPHRHDEDDEQVSAVYYIDVPSDSGDLVLIDADVRQVIKPQEGLLVYFKPNVLHEVTKNSSSKTRLSIGMNFGVHQ